MNKKSILITNPLLITEWHSTLNTGVTPGDVSAGSDKKVWWQCCRDDDHVWEAAVKSRCKGAGCPFCSGRRPTRTNNLQALYPDISLQWHPVKNGDLKPSQVKPGSSKRVWWKCSEEKDHEWISDVCSRTNGNGCPCCSNRKVVPSNSLKTRNPDLANQWHRSKNGQLTAHDVTYVAGKRVWWQCPAHPGHEWEATVLSRSKGSGCPFCSGHRVSTTNSLAFLRPDIADQWHPTKNGSLTPAEVTVSSGKKVWWKCSKGDDHEWETYVCSRSKGSGCPICSNQKLAPSNSLAAKNPELAAQWHPTRNCDLTPEDVLPSSNVKVWWQCPKDPDHEWEATLNNRSGNKGCPICSNHLLIRKNSLGVVNPNLAGQWHPTKNGSLTPFDVAPSSSRRVWWKCPRGEDHEWKTTVNHRSTGTGCPKCNPVWSVPELRIYCELKSIFAETEHRAVVKGQEVDVYIPEIKVGIEYDGVYWHHDKVFRDKEKSEILEPVILLIRLREFGLPAVGTCDIRMGEDGFSLSSVQEILSIVKEKVKLSIEHGEEVEKYLQAEDWVASDLFQNIYSERKMVQFEKSLLYLLPELASQWHPTLNKGLVPGQFTPGAGRSVWWLGECGHEWEDTINHRSSGRDCPECKYRKASSTRKRGRSKNQLKLFD